MLERNLVLPACAGVIPIRKAKNLRAISFTRMRGGDPESSNRYSDNHQFYPHARG